MRVKAPVLDLDSFVTVAEVLLTQLLDLVELGIVDLLRGEDEISESHLDNQRFIKDQEELDRDIE